MRMDKEQMWNDWPKFLEHALQKIWNEQMRLRTYNNTAAGLKKATKQL